MTYNKKGRTHLALGIIFFLCINNPGFSQKQITASIEVCPNYLWHVFAVANIWDKDPGQYSIKYNNSIPLNERQFIYNNRNYLAWGNGKTGKFSKLLFFLPLNKQKSFDKYTEYLDDVLRYANNKQWPAFAKKYYTDSSDYRTISSYKFEKQDVLALDSICNILKKNYINYYNDIWPEIKSMLEIVKSKIDSAFVDSRIIEKWEKATGMRYPEDKFEIVLSYANAIDNLPSANNLGSDRNNFGVSLEHIKYTQDLIIHEIGIFTIMPVIIKLFEDTSLHHPFIMDNGLIYQAIESYIELKKEEITANKKEWQGEIFGGGTFNFKWFFNYYRKNDADYKPEEIIKEAIWAYKNEFSK